MPTDRKEKISFDTHAGKKLRNKRIQLKLTQTDVANSTNKTFQQVQVFTTQQSATKQVKQSQLAQATPLLVA